MQWLGFVLDLSKGQIEVPEDRIAAVKVKLQKICQARLVSAKHLASVVGSIISMSLAIGPVACSMTRSMYTLLETRLSWWESLEITLEAREELEFWKACLADFNCQPIWHSPSVVRVVYSDASDTRYGGFVVEHGPCVAYGQWTTQEAQQSSTWRELTAVLQVLMAVAPKLKNCRVCWFTDNQNVARILQVGSKNHSCMQKPSECSPCQCSIKLDWNQNGFQGILMREQIILLIMTTGNLTLQCLLT